MTKEQYIDEIMGLRFRMGEQSTIYTFGGFRIKKNPNVNQLRLYGSWYDSNLYPNRPKKNSDEDWIYIQTRLTTGQWSFVLNPKQKSYLEDLYGWYSIGRGEVKRNRLKLIGGVLRKDAYTWLEREELREAIKEKESY